MKNSFFVHSVLAGLLFVAPIVVRADVVTQDILDSIAQLPGNDAVSRTRMESCIATDAIVKGQTNPAYGETSTPVPQWKTLQTQNGASLSIPWSPYWYIVGKQIFWYDKDDYDSETPRYEPDGKEHTYFDKYWFGKYQTGDMCKLVREYYAKIYAGTTLESVYVKRRTWGMKATIMEKFTLNNRPAMLLRKTNEACDQESVAVQITKSKKPYVIEFSHFCGDLTSEMLRMAARVK